MASENDICSMDAVTLASNIGGTTIGRPYASGTFSVSHDGTLAYTQTRPEYPADVAIAAEGPVGLPVFAARLEATNADAQRLAGKRVVAFAGIARPQKFFATLSALGAEIVDSLVFPDHHPYTGP